MQAWRCSYTLMPHPLARYNIGKAADLAGQRAVALENLEAYLKAVPDAHSPD
jgi:hypothetical protein